LSLQASLPKNMGVKLILRRILYGLLVLGCLLLALILAGIWLLRGSLPELNGEVITGVSNSVTLERDAGGTITIRASESKDLYFALGYAHGQDRFFSMDLLRRSAAGELSELVGSATLETDKLRRQLGVRKHIERVYANLRASDQETIQAYTAGVNAGLQSLKTRPFPYLLLRSKPRPWTPQDSLLCGMAMYFDLQDAKGLKQVREQGARENLGPQVAAFLFENGRAGSRPINEQPIPVLPAPQTGWAQGEIARSSERLDSEKIPGSNAFAIGPKLTADQRAILAADMHLGLRVPNIWYRARLQLTGRMDAMGATLPGLPLIIVGTNGKVAWGFTNSYIDTLDLVQVDLDSTDTPIQVTSDSISIKGGQTERVTCRTLNSLPVIEMDGRDWIVQWTGIQADFLNLRLLDLMEAGDLAEAFEIATATGMPCQNFVAVDTSGQIGWTLIGGIPKRPQPASRLPLKYEQDWQWQGRLPADSTPSWINPPDNRIWTANNRIMGKEFSELLGDGGYSQQGRDTVIADALFKSDQFTEEDLLSIQYSAQTATFTRWIQWLREQKASGQWTPNSVPDPELWEEVLQSDGQALAESRAYLFIRLFRFFLADEVFSSLLGNLNLSWQKLGIRWDEPLYQIITTPAGQSLDPTGNAWRDSLESAFARTISSIESQYGSIETATWGSRNQLRIQHPLSLGLPFLSRWLDIPGRQVDGDGYSPRAQSPNFGASQRLVVSPNHLDDAIFQMPPGQSGHFLSPVYRAGLEDWVTGRPSPLLPGKALHTLYLNPKIE
jgi:penicillin amidase